MLLKFSTNSAFAALKADGSVITWGDVHYGGDSSAMSNLTSGVVDIFSTDGSFAALKSGMSSLGEICQLHLYHLVEAEMK